MIVTLLSTLFASISVAATFIAEHVPLVCGTIAISIIFYQMFAYYFIGNNDEEHIKTKRRVSPIREADEENNEIEHPLSTRVNVGVSRAKRAEKKTADWVIDAKKIYRSLMKPGRHSPADETSEHSRSNGRPSLRRRHSATGPMQFARAAKDFIVRGRGARFKRQFSELSRSNLPRPPTEFFEPSDIPEVPNHLKPEIFYILHYLKMLELPTDWSLDPKDISAEKYSAGDYIIRPGDDDDSIIAVLDGSVVVYINHGEGKDLKEYKVRRIDKGDCFFSLLSMLEILLNNENKFRNICVRAGTECRLARYKIRTFRESYMKNPGLWSRPIQIVVTRLLHVTLTTLHQYFGLSGELLKKRVDDRRSGEERNRHPSGSHGSFRHKQKTRQRLNSTEEWNEQQTTARKWMADALRIGDHSEALKLINERTVVMTLSENHIISEQNAEEERLVLVVSGTLVLSQEAVYEDEEANDDEWYSMVHPRELIGGLQLLTSEPSFHTVRTHTAATIAILNKEDFAELLEIRPEVILPVAESVIRRLSPFLRSVDFAIDWVLLDSGQAVYRSGDVSDSLFVVLSGRLRSVEKKMLVEEFGRGDMIGMVEVLQRVPRSTTVLAIRFSQLARIPEGLLNYIKMKFPQVGFRLVHLLGHYYSSSNRRTMVANTGFTDHLSGPIGDPRSHIKNLHTVAVIAASANVPLVPFTCELYNALNASLRVLRLSSKKVAEHLDPSVLEKLQSIEPSDGQADFRLMHWLNVQEDTFPLVIYECDNMATNWTRRCLRQADAILLVANGQQKPMKQSFMEEFLSINPDWVRTNKELILLWDEDTVAPQGTIEWLKGSWFSGHHHIRCPKRMTQWNPSTVTEREVIDYYEENVFWDKVDNNSDFARLARILTGNAVGVVLGGGGARGASHVGILRAIREHGIPIDFIGGTSMGAMIAGLYAESDMDVEQRAKEWFMLMNSLWPKIWDLTYAHSAMFTGAGFNKTVQAAFSDIAIEDLWLSYFCITTDISDSEMRVHRSGPLWAYCRASMSLAGYLPPLCDPVDGHLLLDGGYVNNLPADVMRSLGARVVIAVDVGAASENNLLNYGDSLNGFWVLFKKLNPFGEPVKVLNMEEIQSRLAYVSCVRQLEQVKKAPYCHYLRPPITQYETLDFAKFDEIYEVGYKYGSEKFDELVKKSDLLKNIIGPEVLRSLKLQQSRRELSKLANYDRSLASSFTNLAAQVSKIPKVASKDSSNSGNSSDDENNAAEGWWPRSGQHSPDDLRASYVMDDEVEGYVSEPCSGYRYRAHRSLYVDDDQSSTEEEDVGIRATVPIVVSGMSIALKRRQTCAEIPAVTEQEALTMELRIPQRRRRTLTDFTDELHRMNDILHAGGDFVIETSNAFTYNTTSVKTTRSKEVDVALKTDKATTVDSSNANESKAGPR
uniref:NTE family protein n=2 Tax=Ascaris TaxID=6251 RepID=F1KRB4_ASCSU